MSLFAVAVSGFKPRKQCPTGWFYSFIFTHLTHCGMDWTRNLVKDDSFRFHIKQISSVNVLTSELNTVVCLF